MKEKLKTSVMSFLQVHSAEHELILNTPNRNEILKDGPPENSEFNILGRGAYGIVFKAVFKAKQVAVKIVKNIGDMEMPQSMSNEAHVLGWKHRNIVRILKIESTSNFGIVIMERFAGQCLQIILDSIQLPFVHRVFISLDILTALDYCHRRNLLHLDVKPQNILVAFTNSHPVNNITTQMMSKQRNYICKLCDFGSSLKLSEQDQGDAKGLPKGTVRYMSPEVLRDDPLTPAADIYSLGITMWQLQQRQLPYYWLECNEVVAYQVVKHNLRPDSDAALLSTINLQHASEKHRNCLCEHFSSEISYTNRSLENIKNLLNRTESLSFKEAAAESTCSKLRGYPLQKRIPFQELSPQAHGNVPRDLRPSFGVATSARNVEKFAKPSSADCDSQLKSVFSNSTYRHRIDEERTFETIYRSCWHSDHQRRPRSIDLCRKLKEFL